jgi:hypothetical protein
MRRLAIVTALVVALLAAACSNGFSGEPDSTGGAGGGPQLTSIAEAGGVTVEGTWLTEQDLEGVDADVAAYPVEEFVLVEIQFTTHSGDLGQIDMEKATALRQGEADLRPADWIIVSDDSHHRAGVLVFPRDLERGPVELTIEIGNEQLALRWEAAPTT